MPREPLWTTCAWAPPAGHPVTYMVTTALLVTVLGVLIFLYGQRPEGLAVAFFSINELWKVVLGTAAPLLSWLLWWMAPSYRWLQKGATAVRQWLRRE